MTTNEKIVSLLNEFFEEHEEKKWLWLVTKNPLLGGVSPWLMLLDRKEKRLLEFMKHQKEIGEKP